MIKLFEAAKEIPGHPNYRITKDGRIFSNRTKTIKELVWGSSRNGYLKTYVRSNGRSISMSQHRAMMLAYKPHPKAAFLQVDHINGDRSDNRLVNLRWATAKENRQYSIESGRSCGSGSGRTKLSVNDILKIIRLRKRGLSFDKIAVIMKVTQPAIRHVYAGKSYHSRLAFAQLGVIK